jgi:hypothetical protein
MAKKINLIWDVDANKPMILHKPRKAFLFDTQKRFIWRSWELLGTDVKNESLGDTPPAFKIIIRDNVGPWVKKSSPASVVKGIDLVFIAVKTTASGNDCYEVDISFKKVTGKQFPLLGFAYVVEMNAAIMDPRVRPH